MNLKMLFLQIQDNLFFFLCCVAIMVALTLISKLTERLLPIRKVSAPRRACLIAVCGAIACILHLMDFTIPFLAPAFYKLDFSEVPVMLCGLYLGPTAAIACQALKILLKLLLAGTGTAFVGDFANFAVGCSFVLPAVILYHTKKSRSAAIWGLAVGTISLTVFGSAFNAIYLIPKFAQLYGIPLDAIIKMGAAIHGRIDSVTTLVLYCVVPLNLIKGIAVSVLTVLLYKRVARPLFEK